ncbi:hypothetical protein B0H94_11043 [Salsuginibacillus halophilus]|uniref:DUF6884 domain-containing protein n=1 Tax=Salsuginibacillus halophilus TaxID=517424 RepID=A0A2P8HBH3_9BACI|nr:DUF6884 domain-containing protein [Salsuginibacillus halophilus]PSL43567.1 hypothetical protein B0H94_11043 [Salsuginibacillus halophilus]
MTLIYILPPGRAKIWDKDPNTGSTTARNAYTGTLFKRGVAYTEMHNADWVVLSAHHGFLFPDDFIHEPYDVGFHHKSAYVIDHDKLNDMWLKRGLGNYQTIAALTGKKHLKVLAPLLSQHQDLIQPLANCRGIGDMLHNLNFALMHHTYLSSEEVKTFN